METHDEEGWINSATNPGDGGPYHPVNLLYMNKKINNNKQNTMNEFVRQILSSINHFTC